MWRKSLEEEVAHLYTQCENEHREAPDFIVVDVSWIHNYRQVGRRDFGGDPATLLASIISIPMDRDYNMELLEHYVDSYVEGTSEEPSMEELQAIEEQIEEITNEFYCRINDHAATIGLSDAYCYRFEKWGGRNTIILRKYDS